MHLWAESYDRPLSAENILTVQDEIATAIASRIGDAHGLINRAEWARFDRQETKSLRTYDCLLRFYSYSRDMTVEAQNFAQKCLKTAIEDDPPSAEVLSSLSLIYLDKTLGIGEPEPGASFQSAAELAEKAVMLDPTNSRARANFARAAFYMGNVDVARSEAFAALELAPNDVETIGTVLDVISHSGMFDLGHDLMMKLKVIHPDHPGWMNWFVFFKYFIGRDFETSLVWLDRVVMPDWHWTSAFRAVSLCFLGRFEEAEVARQETYEIAPNFDEMFWPETEFFNPHPDSWVRVETFLEGAEQCGWDIPLRPTS
jgi:tetratricopeptide (TPR) repeat protein